MLDRIENPSDLKALRPSQLQQLADELRAEVIDAVSVTGGDWHAALSIVELTVALHYLFDTPADRLIWDAGPQVCPHQILTGRRDRIRALRQSGGLSGFAKRSEGEYDSFGTTHASTSISAALGFSVARDLQHRDNKVVAVIGRDAISGGVAFEGLNNAGAMANKLIVILNDDSISIVPQVQTVSAYLSRLISSKSYRSLRDIGLRASSRLPPAVQKSAQRAESHVRSFVTGGTLFEELGMFYVGPIDGHNMNHLIPILRNIRDDNDDDNDGPILIHVVTQRETGRPPAKSSDDRLQGVGESEGADGASDGGASDPPTCARVFANSLIEEARRDDRIVAVTAALPSGTGVDPFGEVYPDRTFNVGLSEQHAVTFAAGLAADGMKPFAAISSTFLQRAFDQIVHDVAIQHLPVRFAVGQAGFVGFDGQDHCGAFDIAYMGCLPGMILMAAADEAELVRMVAAAVAIDDRPCAFRYPRGGVGVGVALPENPEALSLGQGRIVREGTRVALLSYGARLQDCLEAAEELDASSLSTTVADARFAKPLDEDLVKRLAANHEILVTIEEGSVGGFATQVMHVLARTGAFDSGLVFRPMVMPDAFLDQDTVEQQVQVAGLDGTSIVATVRLALGKEAGAD